MPPPPRNTESDNDSEQESTTSSRSRSSTRSSKPIIYRNLSKLSASRSRQQKDLAFKLSIKGKKLYGVKNVVNKRGNGFNSSANCSIVLLKIKKSKGEYKIVHPKFFSYSKLTKSMANELIDKGAIVLNSKGHRSKSRSRSRSSSRRRKSKSKSSSRKRKSRKNKKSKSKSSSRRRKSRKNKKSKSKSSTRSSTRRKNRK